MPRDVGLHVGPGAVADRGLVVPVAGTNGRKISYLSWLFAEQFAERPEALSVLFPWRSNRMPLPGGCRTKAYDGSSGELIHGRPADNMTVALITATSLLKQPQSTHNILEYAMLHFGCTLCGKCCTLNGSDDLFLTIDEFDKYANDFLLQGIVTISNPPASEAKLVAQNNGIADPIVIADIERTLASQCDVLHFDGPPFSLSLTAHVAMLPKVGGACWALVDNKCSIYQSRPYSCQTYPFPINAPLSAAEELINEVMRGDVDCDTSDSAPPLIDNGMILSAAHQNAMQHSGKANQLRKRLSAAIKWHPSIMPQMQQMIKNAVQNGKGTSRMNVMPFLAAAEAFGYISKARAKDIIERQRDIAIARIDDAKSKKLSTEKTNTMLLGHFVRDYADLLRDWDSAPLSIFNFARAV